MQIKITFDRTIPEGAYCYDLWDIEGVNGGMVLTRYSANPVRYIAVKNLGRPIPIKEYPATLASVEAIAGIVVSATQK